MIDYAQRLWQNLELLDFPLEHSMDSFMNKSDSKLADKMIHFLFTKLSPKESFIVSCPRALSMLIVIEI